MSIFGVIKSLFAPAKEIIDTLSESSDTKAKLKNELAVAQVTIQEKFLDYETKMAELKATTINAEIKGESYLQKNWRPITMLSFVAVIVSNYLIAPYLGALFGVKLMFVIPEKMWVLLTLGIGGYQGLRSVDKFVKEKYGNNK